MIRGLAGLLVAAVLLAPASPTAVSSSPAGKDGQLAFVLLGKSAMPTADAVLRAYERIATAKGAPHLAVARSGPRADTATDVLFFDLGGAEVTVGLVPAPVPKNEADGLARYSFFGARNGWTLPSHSAHLIVFARGTRPAPAIERVRRFTWVLASVARASSAVAIYWADSGATHHAGYFADIAAAKQQALAMTLWSGVSVASDRGNPKRMSLLSLGMGQLGLPNLELTVPRSMEKEDALYFMFNLLSYVATRGSPIPDGETVGRSDKERLPVHYVPSPIDPEVKVWRVEVPGK